MNLKAFVIIGLALTFFACGDDAEVVNKPCTVEQLDDGARMTCPNGQSYIFKDAPAGKDASSFEMLLETSYLEPNQICPRGGIEFFIGRDDNNNRKLDKDERVDSQVICAAKDGLVGIETLGTVDTVMPGQQCPAGGSSFRVGKDLNRNGQLEQDETEFTSTVCKLSVNFCSKEHLTILNQPCQPWYAMDIEANVVESTLDNTSAMDLAGKTSVKGRLIYPWLREEPIAAGSRYIYGYEPGEVLASWEVGNQTIEGVTGGSWTVGNIDVGFGYNMSFNGLSSDGQGLAIASMTMDVISPQRQLTDYRVISPTLLATFLPLRMKITDQQQGQIVIEITSITPVQNVDSLPE